MDQPTKSIHDLTGEELVQYLEGVFEEIRIRRRMEWPLDSNRQNVYRFHQWLEASSDALIGRMVKEYIQEAEHGSWEGFTYRNIISFYRLFADINRYIEAHHSSRGS